MDIGRLKYTVLVHSQQEIEGAYGDKEVAYSTAADKSFRCSINFNPSSRTEQNSQVTYGNTVLVYAWQHNVSDSLKGAILSLNEKGTERYFLVSKVIPAIGRNGINYATIEATEVFQEDINWLSSDTFEALFYVGTSLIERRTTYAGKMLGSLPVVEGTIEAPFLGWKDSSGEEVTAQTEIEGNLSLYAAFDEVVPERTVENILSKMRQEQPDLHNNLIAWFDPTLGLREDTDGYVLTDLLATVLDRSGWNLGDHASYNKFPLNSYDSETGLFTFGVGANVTILAPTSIWTATSYNETTHFGYYQNSLLIGETKDDFINAQGLSRGVTKFHNTRFDNTTVTAEPYLALNTYSNTSVTTSSSSSYLISSDFESGANLCTRWFSTVAYGVANGNTINVTSRESNQTNLTTSKAAAISAPNSYLVQVKIADIDAYQEAFVKIGYNIAFSKALTPEEVQWVWDNMVDPRYYREPKEPVLTLGLTSLTNSNNEEDEN